MTRFFFDLYECGRTPAIDEDGAELTDLPAARLYAIAAARSVMAEEVVGGRLCLGCAITVRDGSGDVVTAVPFAEALFITFTNDR